MDRLVAPAVTTPYQTQRSGSRRPRLWLANLGALWSAVAAGLAAAWLLEWLPHPFADEAAVFWGAVFAATDFRVGSSFVLALGVGGAVCAAVLRRHLLRGVGVGRVGHLTAWFVAGVAMLVLVHGQLLAILGYGPVVMVLGWSQPGLTGDYLRQLVEPDALFVAYGLLGALIWGRFALGLRRHRRGACPDCGRVSDWSSDHEHRTRSRALLVGRRAVAVAVVSAMAYPAVRLPWLFGIPVGIDPEAWDSLRSDPAAIPTGVALAVVGLAGVSLMIGLVRDWGVRVPNRILGFAGRRVPIPVAVVPASIVAIAFVALGRGVVTTVLTGGFETPIGSMWLQAVALVAMLPWGIGLGVATAAYAIRRRAECDACGRGLPELAPSAMGRSARVSVSSDRSGRRQRSPVVSKPRS